MDLTTYDYIVVNTSAGKDSQAMTDLICRQAKEQGCLERVVMVHCDLGRVEWKGTRELAEKHAAHYGVRFEVVSRVHKQGDLLVQIEERGMFPDSQNRYCTSDQKRGQVDTLFTVLTDEFRNRIIGRVAKKIRQEDGSELTAAELRDIKRRLRRCRILNCLGLRGDESPARAKKEAFTEAGRSSNGKRQVDHWLPIHGWTVEQVWATIKASGVEYHYAYKLGLPRVSCVFCIFSPKPALILAGHHNPDLLAEYVRVEQKIGHTFRVNQSLADIQAAVLAGEKPAAVADWVM